MADIARNVAAIETLRTEHGVTVAPTPADIHNALMEAGGVVLANGAAENEFFKRVIEHQEAFAEKVQPSWGEVLKIYGDLEVD